MAETDLPQKKSLVKHLLDYSVGVVKRLPFVDWVVYIEDIRKERKKFSSKEFIGHLAYNIIGGGAISIYVLSGAVDGTWTPKQRKEFKLERQEQKKYKNNINTSYNKLFENAANFEDSLKVYLENPELRKNIELKEPSFEDSLRIYQEHGLPIKLEEPSFEDKERALEGKVE